MYRIQQVTEDTKQTKTINLPDGTFFTMTLYFVPMQFGWFITELTYQDFVLKGLRITNSPNMLHQFKNQIPFGLACLSTDNREPSQQEDFSSNASILYLLDQDEVIAYTEYLSGR